MLNVIILKFVKFCSVTPLWNASMFLQARQKKSTPTVTMTRSAVLRRLVVNISCEQQSKFKGEPLSLPKQSW